MYVHGCWAKHSVKVPPHTQTLLSKVLLGHQWQGGRSRHVVNTGAINSANLLYAEVRCWVVTGCIVSSSAWVIICWMYCLITYKICLPSSSRHCTSVLVGPAAVRHWSAVETPRPAAIVDLQSPRRPPVEACHCWRSLFCCCWPTTL